MAIKSFQQFIAEEAPGTTEEQVTTIRNLLAAIISSGAMDAFIARDLLMKEAVANAKRGVLNAKQAELANVGELAKDRKSVV